MYNVVLVSGVQQSDSVDLVDISIYVYTCIYFFIFVSIMIYFSFQLSSVTQSCPTLCDPMDCHMPGYPVHHQLPELAQTHIHRVGDAIHPTHFLSSLLFLPSILPSLTSIHDYWKNHSFDYTDLCWQSNVSAF